MSVTGRRSQLLILIAASLFAACSNSGDEKVTTPRSAVNVGPATQAQLVQHALLAFHARDNAIVGGSRTHDAIVRDGAIELTPYTFEAGERTAHAAMKLQTASIDAGGAVIGGGAASAAVVNGNVQIARGGAVEHLRNDIDGLHQEWSFASAPGAGDLTFEVAVSGYKYLSSTAGGLHFIGDGVLVRYSHAEWAGTDGKSWQIAATYDASTGRIRMTVPADVMAATKFPAVLDPTISAEVAADSPVTAPSGQVEQQTAIAFGGGEYLVVWSDLRDSNDADIWGTRLGSDGTVMDTLGLKIGATAGSQAHPAVAFDGTAFVVAWEDFLVHGGTTSNIAVASVATDGTITSLGHVTSAASSQTTPNLASAGGGSSLVVWNTAGEVDAAVVSTSIGSTTAVGTGALVERPSVAAAPAGNYLVNFTVTNHLVGQLVTAAGALSGSQITISAPASGAQSASDATFDGTNYDVVWKNGADAHVYGTRVSTAGAVLDTRTVGTTTVGGVAINGSPAQSFSPTISCQSTGCLVVWQDQRTFSTSNYDLFGQLLTLAFAKSGTELSISTSPGAQQIPRAASNGTAFYVSWTDNHNLAVNQAYGQTVTSAGVNGTATAIGTGNNRESAVAIGVGGTNTGLFWRDSRGNPSIYFVRYDSTGTALDTTGKAVQAATTGSQQTPAATADLGGNTLVVWADTRGGSNNDVYAARVDLSTGTTLDASGIAISSGANDQLVPAVASNGSVALVVWQDLRNGNFDIYGALVNSSGAIVANDIAVSVGTGAQDAPAVTWDPTSSQFIVIWQDNRSGTFEIMGARVDATGAVLDSAGVGPLVSSAAGQDSAAIASSATESLAIWHDGTHVRGTRLSGGSALTVLDTAGLALSSTSSNQMNPKVGMLGSGYVVVWADDRAGNQDIYGQLVATSGTLNGTDFGISTSTDDEVLPRVMATGAGSARVAYEARRLDTSRVVSRVLTNAIQSIAVTPANPTIAKGATQQFTATATFSDGSTGDVTSSVTWSSSNTAAATINTTGLATGVAQGTATITATSGAVSGSTLLTVGAAALSSITVTPATANVGVGFKQQFVATGMYSDGTSSNVTSTVVWSSSMTSVATVSNLSGSKGVATVVAMGTTTITATQGTISGTATLNGTNATLSSITVTPANSSFFVNQKKQMHATGMLSDGTTVDLTTQVTWTSSDMTVATIASNAVASAVALGTTTITATKGTVSGSTPLNVVAPTITSITVSPQGVWLVVAQTQAYTASGKFNDGSTQDVTSTCAWTSSNTAVATMATNTATAVGAGATTIKCTIGTVSASSTLNVTKSALASIAVTPTTANVANGFKGQFVATGTYADGSTANLTGVVLWASSATNIATISNMSGSRGMASVVGVGTTTISATLNGISGSATLNGTAATLTSIAVTPATLSLTASQSRQMHATGTFSDSTTLDITTQVTWTSSNTAAATIGNMGVVTAVATGSTTITAASGGVSGTATVTVQ
jgi:uncharacterized protein YjdB